MTIAKPDGPAVLELTDVSKAFGPVQALSNVSLKLVPGQVHCLAGENGAGKSTLIKVLTGALHRDSGSYDIEGQPVTTATPAALRHASNAPARKRRWMRAETRWRGTGKRL